MRIVILAGAPGSGKSTYARKLREEFYSTANTDDECVILSTDDHLYVNGVYTYTPELLTKGHAKVIREFCDTCAEPTYEEGGKTELLIVDNCNSKHVDIAPYIAIARAYGHEPEVVVLTGSDAKGRGSTQVDTLTGRNIHNVPRLKIETVLDQLSSALKYWPHHWPTPKVI